MIGTMSCDPSDGLCIIESCFVVFFSYFCWQSSYIMNLLRWINGIGANGCCTFRSHFRCSLGVVVSWLILAASCRHEYLSSKIVISFQHKITDKLHASFVFKTPLFYVGVGTCLPPPSCSYYLQMSAWIGSKSHFVLPFSRCPCCYGHQISASMRDPSCCKIHGNEPCLHFNRSVCPKMLTGQSALRIFFPSWAQHSKNANVFHRTKPS